MKSSSFCNNGSCVYVGTDGTNVKVSNSRLGAKMTFTPAEWDAFIEGVKAREFETSNVLKGK
jgi:hypothetical protein